MTARYMRADVRDWAGGLELTLQMIGRNHGGLVCAHLGRGVSLSAGPALPASAAAPRDNYCSVHPGLTCLGLACSSHTRYHSLNMPA